MDSARTVRPDLLTSAKPPTMASDLGLALFGVVDRQRAVSDRRHERRMVFQHAEVTLGAGHDDHVHVLRADELFRRDEFEVQHLFTFSLSPLAGVWGSEG
jgi:hypothetical protein